VVGVDVAVIVFVRSALSALISLPISRSASRVALVAGILLASEYTLYAYAAVTIGVGAAAYLLYTAPLWTTLTALLYGEKPGRGPLIGVALIVSAVAILLAGSPENLFRLSVGLAAGLLYGVYLAYVRYYSAKGLDVEVSVAAMPYTVLVALPLFVFRFVSGGVEMERTASATLAGVYQAVFISLIPYRLYAYGSRRLSASRASVIASLEPVLAALWGFLFFGETPKPLEALAYGMITAAAVLSAL